MTRRGEVTRARLIEATRAVVRDVGYPRASTRAIAQAAGVAEGTIYRHFPHKTALFFAAVLEANAPVIDRIAALPGRAGEGTVEGNLVEATVHLASLRDEIMPLELAIAADPELSAQRSEAMAAAGPSLPGPAEALAAYLAAEQRLGRIREDVEPREAAALLLGLLFALGTMPSSDAADLTARVASAVRLVVRGVLPAPASH